MSTLAPFQHSVYTRPAPNAAGARRARGQTPIVLEAVLARIGAAREYAQAGDLDGKRQALLAAIELVRDLQAQLAPGAANAFAANLAELYEYVARRLGCADRGDVTSVLDAVADLLREVRCAWVAMAHESAPEPVGAPAG